MVLAIYPLTNPADEIVLRPTTCPEIGHDRCLQCTISRLIPDGVAIILLGSEDNAAAGFRVLLIDQIPSYVDYLLSNLMTEWLLPNIISVPLSHNVTSEI